MDLAPSLNAFFQGVGGLFQLFPYWPFVFPTALLGYTLLQWWKSGRNPKGRELVIAQYEEPYGLKPAQLAIMRETYDLNVLILVTVLDLGRREYLALDLVSREQPQKAALIVHRLMVPDDGLEPFERTLFDLLFSADHPDQYDLGNPALYSFANAKSIALFQTQATERLVDDGYLASDQSRVFGRWIGMGLLFVFLPFFLPVGNLFVISLVLTGVVCFLAAYIFPSATKKGALLLEEIEGFRVFLQTTERGRLIVPVHEASTEIFSRFLPSAVALGVDNLFKNRFTGALVPPKYLHIPNNDTQAFVDAVSRLRQSSSK